MGNAKLFGRRFACFFFLILLLSTGPAHASGAELSNLVIKNNREDLLIDLKINGVFTNEMRAALSSGIPVSFTVLVILYEVHDFWFDTRLAHITTNHNIQYDALKKEYSILRAWEKTGPLVVKEFDNACLLISEITGLKITPLSVLKKEKHYQVTVKSELVDKKFHIFNLPWGFETDWYTINFIY